MRVQDPKPKRQQRSYNSLRWQEALASRGMSRGFYSLGRTLAFFTMLGWGRSLGNKTNTP